MSAFRSTALATGISSQASLLLPVYPASALYLLCGASYTDFATGRPFLDVVSWKVNMLPSVYVSLILVS